MAISPREDRLANDTVLQYSSSIAPVAQLDRALPSGGRGCGFEPRQAYQHMLPATFRATLPFYTIL